MCNINGDDYCGCYDEKSKDWTYVKCNEKALNFYKIEQKNGKYCLTNTTMKTTKDIVNYNNKSTSVDEKLIRQWHDYFKKILVDQNCMQKYF